MICLVNAGVGRMAENISPLVLEEYLSKGDDRFLPVRISRSEKAHLHRRALESATIDRGGEADL